LLSDAPWGDIRNIKISPFWDFPINLLSNPNQSNTMTAAETVFLVYAVEGFPRKFMILTKIRDGTPLSAIMLYYGYFNMVSHLMPSRPFFAIRQ
jgi:hypothetical protein